MDVVVVLFLGFFAQEGHTVVYLLEGLFLRGGLACPAPPFSSLVGCSAHAAHAALGGIKIFEIVIAGAGLALGVYLHELFLDLVGFVDLVVAFHFDLFGQVFNVEPF